jgi:methionyl-tRNA formyltransferase
MSKSLSIIFFGTHEFAAIILAGIIADENYSVRAVVTQPDRPMGRKQIMTPSPVKILALENKLTIYQPETLKRFNLETHADLYIVAQYGLLIPEEIISLPQFHTINVHTSLLPKYRGASPIQSALIHGETNTGVTIMVMDKGMDTGPLLSQRAIAIDSDDTYPILDKKLAYIGRDLLLETIPPYIQGSLKAIPQDESKATICSKFDRSSGLINWNKPATEIYNLYRGLFPWPGIWTRLNNVRVKLLTVRPAIHTISPGHIQIIDKKLFVGCSMGSLEVLELQVEGKNAQSAQSFIAGYEPHNQNFL